MTWAEYKEIINHTPYNNDLEYKVHYAWIHGEKTFRANMQMVLRDAHGSLT